MEPFWTVAQVQPNCEFKFRDQMSRVQLSEQVYVPAAKHIQKIKYKHQTRMIDKPVFSRYLFILINDYLILETKLHKVEIKPRFMFNRDKQMLKIRFEEIDRIRTSERLGEYDCIPFQPSLVFKKGMIVFVSIEHNWLGGSQVTLINDVEAGEKFAFVDGYGKKIKIPLYFIEKVCSR